MSRIRRAHRFTITPEALIFDQRVSPGGIRLWMALDRIAGPSDGALVPSRRELGELLGVSPDTIDEWKKSLVNTGWLVVESGGNAEGDRRGSTNCYVLVDDVEPPGGGVPQISGCGKDAAGGAANLPHPTSSIEMPETNPTPQRTSSSPPPEGDATGSHLAAVPDKPPTAHQRRTSTAQGFLKPWWDRQSGLVWGYLAVRGLVVKALAAQHEPDAILAALDKLLAEGRTPSSGTLDAALRHPRGTPSGHQPYRDPSPGAYASSEQLPDWARAAMSTPDDLPGAHHG